jgi:hypothetical protein
MHEIIHVVDVAAPQGFARLDLEVEAVEGRPLAAGYYFALWPMHKKAAKRRGGKRHFGPLANAAHARLLQVSALMLGLAEDVQPRQAIVECRSIARHAAAANDCCAGRPASVAYRAHAAG